MYGHHLLKKLEFSISFIVHMIEQRVNIRTKIEEEEKEKLQKLQQE
jgi:hypothetical protein